MRSDVECFCDGDRMRKTGGDYAGISEGTTLVRAEVSGKDCTGNGFTGQHGCDFACNDGGENHFPIRINDIQRRDPLNAIGRADGGVFLPGRIEKLDARKLLKSS